MATEVRSTWTEEQRIAAFRLYCQLPFGKLHKGTAEIIKLAGLMGKTPSSVAMKLCNFASLDPVIRDSGRKGLAGASKGDQKVWDAFHQDWQGLVHASDKILDGLGWTEDLVDLEQGDDHFGGTREAMIEVRVGQSFFGDLFSRTTRGDAA